jgi:exosortase A-associated hydrolase 1
LVNDRNNEAPRTSQSDSGGAGGGLVKIWHEQPLFISCANDQLIGILHDASNLEAPVGVIMVVGGPQYRIGSHRQFVLMARAMAARGYHVLRFDYRGMGDSDGEPRDFRHVELDLRVALDAFFSAVPSLTKVILWGLCDAASAVSMHRPRDARVIGLVLVNPWVRSEAGAARAYLRHYYVQRLFQRSFWRKLFDGSVNPRVVLSELLSKYRRARTLKSAIPPPPEAPFIDRMAVGLSSFPGPLLVQISGRDLTAAEFMDLSRIDRKWKTILSRPNVTIAKFAGADHTFSIRADLERATAQCCSWMDTHS